MYSYSSVLGRKCSLPLTVIRFSNNDNDDVTGCGGKLVWNGGAHRVCRCPSNFPSSSSSGRRLFLAANLNLMLPNPSFASDSTFAMLNKVHPPRPGWYEELYALALHQGMKSYEAEIAAYKTELFSHLRGKNKKVLELGVGTGPNFKYYAGKSGIRVFCIDPNQRMEKYVKASAVASGLPASNFSFIQAVGEALPVDDASMDAVIGTLVLCSVGNVDLTLKEVMRVLKPGGQYLFMEHVAAKDGTLLRFMQNVFDPLQQLVSDGCHLTRETGKKISTAGFLYVNTSIKFLSSASLISPHVYGIACK